ncbi:hypothetical protein ON010_g8008 [Phytophthora cinnamomi]|nr:hypothetical protein ON010_g8008 [Phytophthora cinnamomi]
MHQRSITLRVSSCSLLVCTASRSPSVAGAPSSPRSACCVPPPRRGRLATSWTDSKYGFTAQGGATTTVVDDCLPENEWFFFAPPANRSWPAQYPPVENPRIWQARPASTRFHSASYIVNTPEQVLRGMKGSDISCLHDLQYRRFNWSDLHAIPEIRQEMWSYMASALGVASASEAPQDAPSPPSNQDGDVERACFRLRSRGWLDRENELYLSVPKSATARCNVIFFPGDVQDFKAAMYVAACCPRAARTYSYWENDLFCARLAGPFADYSDYAYEAVAELLSDKFGDTCNVWVVRPSRFKHGAYSSFDNFVTTNEYGAATKCASLADKTVCFKVEKALTHFVNPVFLRR